MAVTDDVPDGEGFEPFREADFQSWLEPILPVLFPFTTVVREPQLAHGMRPDFIGMRRGNRYAIIEVIGRAFRTRERIQNAADKLIRYGETFTSKNTTRDVPELILIAATEISPNYLELIANRGIRVVDGLELARLLDQHGIEVPDFLRNTKTGIDFLRGAKRGILTPQETRMPVIYEMLSSISPGKAAWAEYQAFCGDLLSSLFSPPLMQPIPELATASRVNRRDFILPNYATDGFWYYLRREYHADFVVVDAKNYTNGVGKSQILQIANYLNVHGVGLFGLILSRVGAQKSATLTIREQWILHRKLIVVLDDGDARQMLTMKKLGNDPTEVLKQRIEDFRLSF